MDGIDQFLSEIVNQKWNENQLPANYNSVKTSQTMFPGSRVQPLSLPELYAWAVELRIQVRSQIMQPVEEFIVPSPMLPMKRASKTSKATETSHR